MEDSIKKKRLKPEHKLFVVQCLARFMTPLEVEKLVREDFGVSITRQSVEAYDPSKAAGGKLDEELKQVFYRTREQFIADIDGIDVSHRSFRLTQLSNLYRTAFRQGATVIAAQFLEQAAKECGGIFTNRREHSGPAGAPIALSVEDKKLGLARIMLKKLLAKGESEEEARATLTNLGIDNADDL
jgi:hypothetical protein